MGMRPPPSLLPLALLSPPEGVKPAREPSLSPITNAGSAVKPPRLPGRLLRTDPGPPAVARSALSRAGEAATEAVGVSSREDSAGVGADAARAELGAGAGLRRGSGAESSETKLEEPGNVRVERWEKGSWGTACDGAWLRGAGLGRMLTSRGAEGR
jgi:hypothetical protein